jgi:hypothetical protein
MITIEYLDIMNQVQQTKISIVTTGSGVQSAACTETGIYFVWWDVPCLLKINTTVSDTVTADTGLEMTAAGMYPFRIDAGMMITAKATSTDGTVRWMKVG